MEGRLRFFFFFFGRGERASCTCRTCVPTPRTSRQFLKKAIVAARGLSTAAQPHARQHTLSSTTTHTHICIMAFSVMGSSIAAAAASSGARQQQQRAAASTRTAGAPTSRGSSNDSFAAGSGEGTRRLKQQRPNLRVRSLPRHHIPSPVYHRRNRHHDHCFPRHTQLCRGRRPLASPFF
jgi:hypothetical protein